MLGIFLVACAPKAITFKQGYEEMISLDAKHDADFREEIIEDGGISAPIGNINGLIADLDSLKERYSRMPQTNDTIALQSLIQARTDMLEAERYYQLFANIGSEGLVVYNFTCAQVPAITRATSHMQNTINYTNKATVGLDDLLINYPDITRPVLGTDDNKINFYNSDLYFLDNEIRRNRLSVKKYCGVVI